MQKEEEVVVDVSHLFFYAVSGMEARLARFRKLTAVTKGWTVSVQALALILGALR